MSDLTKAIERICQYFSRDFEQGQIILNPGIYKTELDNIASSLPFKLPQEIYEIYSWANGVYMGGNIIFAGLDFLSLEEAIEAHTQTLAQARKEALMSGRKAVESWWNQNWFPIFRIEEGYYFIIGNKIQNKASPIFCYDYKDWDDLRPKYKYINLTQMIQTLAECHETNAYKLITGEYGKYLEEDYEKIEAIRLKYNPGVYGTYYDLMPEEKFYMPGY